MCFFAFFLPIKSCIIIILTLSFPTLVSASSNNRARAPFDKIAQFYYHPHRSDRNSGPIDLPQIDERNGASAKSSPNPKLPYFRRPSREINCLFFYCSSQSECVGKIVVCMRVCMSFNKPNPRFKRKETTCHVLLIGSSPSK